MRTSACCSKFLKQLTSAWTCDHIEAATADLSPQNGITANPTSAQVVHSLHNSTLVSISVLSVHVAMASVNAEMFICVQLPGGEYKARTGVNSREEYEQLYKQSLADPAAFWGKFAQDYYWQQKVPRVLDIHDVLLMRITFEQLTTLLESSQC